MEGHPEEDDNSEDEQEGDDAVFGLLWCQFLNRSGSSLCLLGSHIGMLEPIAEDEIYQRRENE